MALELVFVISLQNVDGLARHTRVQLVLQVELSSVHNVILFDILLDFDADLVADGGGLDVLVVHLQRRDAPENDVLSLAGALCVRTRGRCERTRNGRTRAKTTTTMCVLQVSTESRVYGGETLHTTAQMDLAPNP